MHVRDREQLSTFKVPKRELSVKCRSSYVFIRYEYTCTFQSQRHQYTNEHVNCKLDLITLLNTYKVVESMDMIRGLYLHIIFKMYLVARTNKDKPD